MKTKKTILCLLTVSLLSMSVVPAMTVRASESSVIKKLCGRFSDYLSYSVGGQKDGETISLDLKKRKDRKKALRFMPDLLSKMGASDASKFLFGKRVSGKMTVTNIDWRENRDIIKIKKIVKKQGRKYQVNFDLIYHEDSDNTKKKYGSGVFYLKKVKNSRYIVTKLKVKKICRSPGLI